MSEPFRFPSESWAVGKAWELVNALGLAGDAHVAVTTLNAIRQTIEKCAQVAEGATCSEGCGANWESGVAVRELLP